MIGLHPLDLSAPRLASIAHKAYNHDSVYAIWIGKDCLYVGVSSHPRSRVRTHRQQLQKGNHYNATMQAIYNQRKEEGLFATLLPPRPSPRARHELEWIGELKPLSNVDTCSADFHPITRHLRKLARGLELTVKPKDPE